MFGEYKITWDFNGNSYKGKAIFKEEGFNMARIIFETEDGSNNIENLIVSLEEGELALNQLKKLKFDVTDFDLREWLFELD